MRKYSELIQLSSFQDRFDYLRLAGAVGEDTFGFDRYLNQAFYTSTQWKNMRNFVIARDLGCDLGIEDYPIRTKLIVHHMNPITAKNLRHGDLALLDPENLITTTHKTHNAIHYGGVSPRLIEYIPRSPGDTTLW